MHNHTAERNRRNRRSETKIIDKNKSEDFREVDMIILNNAVVILNNDVNNFEKAAIIAIKNVFAIVNKEIKINSTIETTIKNFRNIISILIKVTKFFIENIMIKDFFATKDFCKQLNK